MTWTKAKFVDWDCWESRVNPQLIYRIIHSDQGWELYRDNGISTELYDCDSLEQAQKKAESVQLLYAMQLEILR